MKAALLAVALLVIAAAAAAPALAEDDPLMPAPKKDVIVVEPARKVGFIGKFFNGVLNVVVSPLDIPFTVVRETSDTGNPLLGLFVGTVSGTVNGAVRLTAGATEVVTSPVPINDYPLYQRKLGERCFRHKPSF